MRAGLSTRERTILDKLVSDEHLIVQAEDVSRIAQVDRSDANVILSKLAKKGWLQRLVRGKYVVIPVGAATDTPAAEFAWQIASQLYAPCMISGWSAAEHWGLTDQIFNVISLVSRKSQRTKDQRVGGVRFRIRTLPAEKLFGGTNVWSGTIKSQVADPHRTLIDILDAPDFGGGGRHVADIAKEYWKSRHADDETLLAYATRFDRGTVFKRMGLLAEQYGNPSEDWLRRCAAGCSRGISLFDPDGPSTGKIRSRWRIRVNIPLEET